MIIFMVREDLDLMKSPYSLFFSREEWSWDENRNKGKDSVAEIEALSNDTKQTNQWTLTRLWPVPWLEASGFNAALTGSA